MDVVLFSTNNTQGCGFTIAFLFLLFSSIWNNWNKRKVQNCWRMTNSGRQCGDFILPDSKPQDLKADACVCAVASVMSDSLQTVKSPSPTDCSPPGSSVHAGSPG